MKSFKELISLSDVSSLLKKSKIYLAHTPDETLSDHMKLVTQYFQDLIFIHGLEPLLDIQFLKVSNQSISIAEFSKQLFWNAILYHDFGKVNENFQRKLKNYNHFSENVKNGIESQHSILSAYLFLMHQLTVANKLFSEEEPEMQQKIICLIFAFAHNIIRHHNSKLDDLSDPNVFQKLNSELINQLENYLSCYEQIVPSELVNGFVSLKRNNVIFKNLGFELFSLIRLNFSLLTASDYYATSHYCNKWAKSYREFGMLSTEQKNRHFQNLQETQPHNRNLYLKLKEFYSQPLDELQEPSNTNLNKLRSKMAAETIENIRRNADKKLFYIEAPTGGGKTNMAFIATQELLQANYELNKVFYVFPFTTLVTQTQKAAIQTLGLQSDEWMELHGRAAWKQKEDTEKNKDGLYGDERLDDIHNQFVNYPYTFLSHVRFFDILKANEKSSIYLMHRLANSIVVIDEVQAYNPILWDKMAYLLREYAEALNIRFIVMSATLPKIGELAASEFCYLIPNAIERFFVNPNFADRVSFSDELLQKKRPEKEEREAYLEWLTKVVFEKSEQYRQTNGQVRTIIEFIFKKSTSEFAVIAEKLFQDYEIKILSGTILEPRRKQIIEELKSEENKTKNVLLITTQVVEAGVDIDMDLGFKNRSIIDSEEQLAGRVNRNVNKKNCMVYLFELDDASVIYGKDRRFKETRSHLENEYFDILKNKSFDRLYEKVKKWLGSTNEESNLAGTAASYEKELIGKLNFPKIDEEFTLIEHSNTSVFVPLDLPDASFVFSNQQLQFLEELGVSTYKDKLSGEDIFDLYKKLITTDSESFTGKKRNLKMLQSIMSMYTFSLFSESKVVKELKAGGNQEEYGFLYLASHKEVYDIQLGLQDQKFSEMIFL
jgi:CRISPR-associated endonuclease/helicase Cas3